MQRFFLTLLFIFSLTNAFAEIYKDIGPLDTLGDVKSKFPNAAFTKLNPAWAQETDVMYMISGSGMSGQIIIKFYDSRPIYKNKLQEDPNGASSVYYKDIIAQNDEEAISVDWVRWLPDLSIPLTRFVSKYGKYDKSGFSDENFQPYRSWESKGLKAYLTDDEKNVMLVDFIFTNTELKKAYMDKYGRIPPFLQESPAKQK